MINKQEIRTKIIITTIVSVIIPLTLFWRTAAYSSILEQEITFNTEDTISIKGTFDPENIRVYDSKNKTVMYKKGMDYNIKQQKEGVVIHRLENGLIRPREMVFVYINGKDKGAAASNDQSDKENIVAEINGESLTYEKFLRQYNLYLVMSGSPEQNREKITLESYLYPYIIEMLMLREATKIGIKAAGPDEIRRQRQIHLSTTGQTEGTLSANLTKAGFNMEDADRFLEKNFIVNTLCNTKFGAVEISDEEAQKFYSGHPEYFNVADRIKVSHILICHREGQGCKSGLSRQEAKKTAEYIRNLATPEKFAELARQYSMDITTAKDGGNLGYTYKGMAAKAFEDVAFKLNIGEISDPVETDFGFHIIYVTDTKGRRVTTFEEAKESIKEILESDRIRSVINDYSVELLKKADIKTYPIVSSKAADDKAAGDQGSLVAENPAALKNSFRTFKDTGRDICRNDAGLPIIFLFSAEGCSHCRWIKETFEISIMEYVKNGLIEAHHYDLGTNNDLLTAAVETEMPQRYYKIYELGNPGDYVPYFNFGCKYDRIGNGYEKQDDYASEAWEFRRVIDTLLSE